MLSRIDVARTPRCRSAQTLVVRAGAPLADFGLARELLLSSPPWKSRDRDQGTLVQILRSET